MKRVAAILIVAALGVVVWIIWTLHPWMTPGRTAHLSDWEIENYSFQIWQKKNDALLEPFSTAMFVRERTDQRWTAISLGHQDRYSATIVNGVQAVGVPVHSGGP
jgi:hypothetical protein